MQSHLLRWYLMKHQGIQWYTDCIEWIIRESIAVLMLLNETSGNPVIHWIESNWVQWYWIKGWNPTEFDDIEWNIRESSDILIALNESSGNPLLYWCYWMKHQGIQWYTDCIEWIIRESIAVLMLLNETSGNPVIHWIESNWVQWHWIKGCNPTYSDDI